MLGTVRSGVCAVSEIPIPFSPNQATRPVIFLNKIRSLSRRFGARALLVIVLLTTLSTAVDSASAAEFESLKVGFAGTGKVGKWLPVYATVTSAPPGTTVELKALFSDPRGDTCVEIVDRAITDDEGRASLSGHFHSGRLEGFGQVEVAETDSQQLLCRQSIAHGDGVPLSDADTPVMKSLRLYQLDVPFLLTVGKIAGIEELLRDADNFSDDRPILHGVGLSDLSELPTEANGLDAIDLLLLTDDFQITVEQLSAIKEWVLHGGKLFVSTGETVPEFLNSELGKWLGDRFGVESQPLNVRDLSSLQSFVPGATVLRTNREDVSMAVMNSDQTVNDARSLDSTVVGTQSVGAGIVRMVAVDLNRRPLDKWKSLSDLYQVLLFDRKFSSETTRESRSSRISQTGISDLGTQMMATVDAVPEHGRWSTWAVMAMIAAYLLMIGPVDYLLVTYVFKRPHWTWITFPLMVIGGVAAMAFGFSSTGGEQLNQLHLVDVLPVAEGCHVRSQSWMSLSTPDTMRADLTASVGLPIGGMKPRIQPTQLSWSGRPEDIYG